MTKAEMINEVANRSEQTRSRTEKVLEAFIEYVGDELRNGEKVMVSGFGTFEVSMRAARTGKNPATGETIEIPARKGVKFKPSKALKDKIK